MAGDVALVAVLLHCGAKQDVRDGGWKTPLERSGGAVRALLRNPTKQAIARALGEVLEREREQERHRQERERQERHRQERERQEKERQEKERQERERQERERQELSRQRLELPVSEWSVDHVCNMLEMLGSNYAKYADAFRAQDVDGDMLMDFDMAMFTELGVSSKVHALKISKIVKKHTPSTASPSPAAPVSSSTPPSSTPQPGCEAPIGVTNQEIEPFSPIAPESKEDVFDLFLCHASGEIASGVSGKVLAASLYLFLSLLGIRTWLDRANIETAIPNPTAIEQGLASCRALLAVVTKPYMLSSWCQRETVTALTWGKDVLPAFHHSLAEKPVFDAMKQSGGLYRGKPLGGHLARISGVAHESKSDDMALTIVDRFMRLPTSSGVRLSVRSKPRQRDLYQACEREVVRMASISADQLDLAKRTLAVRFSLGI